MIRRFYKAVINDLEYPTNLAFVIADKKVIAKFAIGRKQVDSDYYFEFKMDAVSFDKLELAIGNKIYELQPIYLSVVNVPQSLNEKELQQDLEACGVVLEEIK